MDFFNSTQPRARKDYSCDLCNQIIHKGEVYHRYSGKYDGEMFDDKYHLTCQRIINAYCEDVNDREYCNDMVQDWLHDTYCLDCKHYDYDCTFSELNCPAIQKHYMQEKEGAE